LIFERIESEGLAHFSYIVGIGARCFVIDPRRDCEAYAQTANHKGMTITHIFETHRNEDYAIGSQELAEMTGATIFHGPGLDWEYGETLEDGQRFPFNTLELTALRTPGHTYESMSFVLADKSSGGDPIMVFTGDALFVGDVGRTDLVGPQHRERLSHALYESIQKKILPLGEGVILCPAHGAGSVCGGDISEREVSTLGLEKRQNRMLQLTEAEFVKRKMEERLDRPPYFKQMEIMNLKRRKPLGRLPGPRPLPPKDFEAAIRNGAQVVDVRMPHSFAGAYIKGAKSIWIDGLAVYAGWLLSYDRPLLLVVEDAFQVERAVRTLVRIGYDNVQGYLRGGMVQWLREGMPYEILPTMSVHEAKKEMDEGGSYLLDPRPAHERAEVYVPGSHGLFVGELESNLATIPRDKLVMSMCSAGFRGGMAAAILRDYGYDNVRNVLGGIGAWKAAGYNTVDSD